MIQNWQFPDVHASWQWDREELQAWQLTMLNRQFATILASNEFYRQKLGTRQLSLNSLEELRSLPCTTKEELVASAQLSPAGISTHHTFAPDAYSRLHRTSGTTGEPLIILDTAADWVWWSATWQHVLQAARVTESDRVFLAFSFGPFIGFWSAHQACVDRGATVVPGGGLSSLARLEFMQQSRSTVMCCTPTYALHLMEVAAQENFPLLDLEIDRIIVAGEAGGSIPAVRSRIEQAWQAKLIDHSGATEIGPWGFGWPDKCGLHVIETSFVAELLPLAESDTSSTDDAVGDPAPLSELVLTSLGRLGAPVIRYRTGDAVRVDGSQMGNCGFLWLPQGVVGRADNMVTIRGVNVFPSSIDALVRKIPSIAEYRVLLTRQGSLDQLHVEIEADEDSKKELEKVLQVQLGLRVPVTLQAAGSLPRSEGKSRRWQDHRRV